MNVDLKATVFGYQDGKAKFIIEKIEQSLSSDMLTAKQIFEISGDGETLFNSFLDTCRGNDIDRIHMILPPAPGFFQFATFPLKDCTSYKEIFDIYYTSQKKQFGERFQLQQL